MEKTINILELASELADMKVREILIDFSKIYLREKNGDTRYTEEAQDLFNFWYDQYYDLVEAI
jgi:Mg2+/Co2+ transporter CorC